MKISLNALKKYLDLPPDLATSKLIELIGSRLVEVESVTELAPKYQGVFVVKVISAEPIKGTHLHLCQIDIGSSIETLTYLELSSEGLLQVVCGAPNVHAGMFAVWIAPGFVVPATWQTDEEFRLSVRTLRGYDSCGMLAGADELGLGDEHSGIVELEPDKYAAGTPLCSALDLDDYIIEVENKSLTHRPDAFGLIGFAREVAGILGLPFKTPDFLLESPTTNPSGLKIKVGDSKLCPRYSCAVLPAPNFQPSPYLTNDHLFLIKAGMRPIDPVVDLTNRIMLETGQPLHAFDYHKFLQVGGTKTPEITVRAARKGETLALLDGRTVSCDSNDILITSGDTPVALAGAMGGVDTAVDQNTTKILLESATFSLYHLRKTQMKHGIFSEAITRFTKGQPTGATLPVLQYAIDQLKLYPIAVADFTNQPNTPSSVSLSLSDINSCLGTNYSETKVQKTLENVNFEVKITNGRLDVTSPYWRTDIHIKEDIIEEVGRLLGYDNIIPTLPSRPFTIATIDPLLALKTRLRTLLSSQPSIHEVLTYSFVSKKLLEKAGLDPSDCYELTNSLSPELQHFRPSLIPSLLEKTYENLRRRYHDFTLYEFNQVTTKSSGLTPEQTPKLQTVLTLATCGDYYAAKRQLATIIKELNLPVLKFKSLSSAAPAFFQPLHAAEITFSVPTKKPISLGYLGEISTATLKKFKLSAPVSVFELNLDLLLSLPSSPLKDIKLSKFPSVERDLTFKLSSDHAFVDFETLLLNSLKNYSPDLIFEFSPTSIYQPSSGFTNYSFHLSFASKVSTLATSEISAIIENIINTAATVGATLV